MRCCELRIAKLLMIPLLLSLLASAPQLCADTSSDQSSSPADETARPEVLLVVGHPGAEKYEAMFQRWTAAWEQAAERAQAPLQLIGRQTEGEPSDGQRLQQALQDRAGQGEQPLWLVLIGHGTFDGKAAKFNLRGPDVTALEVRGWLDQVERPTAVINCTASSAPFINQLSKPGRVVVTATKSGYEQNFARFGQHLAAAVGDAEADLDKDGQTSLLEAFLMASKRTQQSYADANQLATEQALLDDNGDGRGTPAEWFQGVRPVRSPVEGAIDGLLANQMHLIPSSRERHASPQFKARRDDLERQIQQLRQRKNELSEDEYYKLLEPLMLQLARHYRTLEQLTPQQ